VRITHKPAGRATVSQPDVPAGMRDRRFVLLGGDADAYAWFQSRGMQVQGRVDRSKPRYDPVAEKVLINMLDKKGRENEN